MTTLKMQVPLVQITKSFRFESAHFLTKYHGKCEHLHGHSYRLWVTIEGEIQENGLLLDFGFLSKIVKERVVDKLDHRLLNDFLENPTSENLAVYIWKELEHLPLYLKEEADNPNLPPEMLRLLASENFEKEVNEKVRLVEIKVSETASSFVVYRGPLPS